MKKNIAFVLGLIIVSFLAFSVDAKVSNKKTSTNLSLASGVLGSAGMATSPNQRVWVADGVTPYRVDVIIDSTGVPTELIRSTSWHLTVPEGLASYFNLYNSSLPQYVRGKIGADWVHTSVDVSDFFYNRIMRETLDYIDNTYDSVNGELDSNVRSTYYRSDIVTNRSGIVGSYWFTISSSTPVGSYSFGLHNGKININDSINPDFAYCNYYDHGDIVWSHCIIENPEILIVKKYGDADGNCVIDQRDYSAWFNNNGLSTASSSLTERVSRGDFDGNGIVDQRDYSLWFNNNGLSCQI